MIAAFFGTVGAVWGDSIGVTAWPWTEYLTGPDVYTVRDPDSALLDDYTVDADMDLPAGKYHLSGEVSVTNGTLFDRDVSCFVYARAAGDADATTLDSTSGPLPRGSEDPYAEAPSFAGGFSSVFELHVAGHVWVECTGGDTGQPPYNGEEKSWPDYPSVGVHLTATPVNSLP
jgi:hypothetical protein